MNIKNAIKAVRYTALLAVAIAVLTGAVWLLIILPSWLTAVISSVVVLGIVFMAILAVLEWDDEEV